MIRENIIEYRVEQVNDSFFPQWKSTKGKKWNNFYHAHLGGNIRIRMETLSLACEVINSDKKSRNPTIKIHKCV